MPSRSLPDGCCIFEAEQILPAPPEELWGFFADASNLERITPPWLRFRVLTPAPIAMRQGTIIDYRLRWRFLPIRWRTLISAWDPPNRFVDEQVRGPYRLWRHEHRFEPLGGGTRMIDRVEYRAPLAALSHPLVVRRDVEGIFAHRRAILEAHPEWLSAEPLRR
ncbi:MAG TPA: SRPBCC family protein [Phycisphaerales bacterium]|nr:SRPBCC family protein [Phycisphaerales bacterium]HMP38033.1 SRPBCC family protein [Phycisphaerales bacterium]